MRTALWLLCSHKLSRWAISVHKPVGQQKHRQFLLTAILNLLKSFRVDISFTEIDKVLKEVFEVSEQGTCSLYLTRTAPESQLNIISACPDWGVSEQL